MVSPSALISSSGPASASRSSRLCAVMRCAVIVIVRSGRSTRPATSHPSNLDSQTSETIIKLLHRLAHSADMTVLVVTHDPALASQSDTTFHLEDGRLSQRSG
jgi:ABC-type hemin transport system ATPase subunit